MSKDNVEDLNMPLLNAEVQHNIKSYKLETDTLPPQKSLFTAYVLWLFGGVFGLHHFYLHRDHHAFVWCCTLGGHFGIGWLFDAFNMPSYVRDANEDPKFIEEFVKKLQFYRKPLFSAKRMFGEIMMGNLFGHLYQRAIPETLFMGIDFGFLHWLIPLFVALGVWTVGNIGREKGVLWHCLLAAFVAYLVCYFLYFEEKTINLTASISSYTFNKVSKEWLSTPPKRRGTIERTLKFAAAVCIYFSLWGCFLYFDGTVTVKNGNKIPVQEALHNFLSFYWWTEMTQNLKDSYNYVQHNGWYETWKEIFESMWCRYAPCKSDTFPESQEEEEEDYITEW